MIGYRRFNTEPDTRPRTIEFSKEDMRKLNDSQFGEFRRLVMGSMNPTMFACLFSAFGRPSCPVDLVIGIMLLATFLGVSEDTILSQLKGNIYYQYALCMDKISCITIPSKRTLIRMRMRLIVYRIAYGVDVLYDQVEIILLNLALKLELKGEYFRMDSLMLNIYAKRLSRAQLLYYVNQGVVLAIVKTSKHELYESERKNNLTIRDVMDSAKIIDSRTVPYELAERLAGEAKLPRELWHYLQLGDYHSKFYRAGSYAGVSKGILDDAVLLWKAYRGTMAHKAEFLLFARVLREQCEWIGHLKSHEGESDVTYTSERILRFKPSKKELAEAEKSNREVEKLGNKLPGLARKREAAARKFEEAKVKAAKATARAEKAKEKGASNFGALAAKAKALDEKATNLGMVYGKLTNEFEEILNTIRATYISRDEADAFVVVESFMERDIERMSSSILQSPLDPDATFCEKAGLYFRGYKVTIIEVSDGKGHSMPVAWTTTQNNISDEVAGAELIRRLGELCSRYSEIFRNLNILGVADGAFSGKEIDEALKEAGVQLVNTDLSGQKVADHLADFEFDETGMKITKCAGGQTPKHRSISHDGMVSAVVKASECAKCKHSKTCTRTTSGENAIMKASVKQKARAFFQRNKGTEAYTAIGRFRNGVEALMGLFKKKSPVTKQPIYGQYRVALFNNLTMAAIGFAKYLSQKEIPHEDMYLNREYSELFPEDEVDVESARIEVERDLRRITRERKAAAQNEARERDVFYAPMVIQQPEEPKEALNVKKVTNAVGREAESIPESEDSSLASSENVQPNVCEANSNTPADANAPEDSSPVEQHQAAEGGISACMYKDIGDNSVAGQRHSDVEAPTSGHAQEERAQISTQVSGGKRPNVLSDTSDTNSSTTLKSFLEAGFTDLQLSRNSCSGRHAKCFDVKATATQGKGVGAA